MVTGISWPYFQVPLHNFLPFIRVWGALMHLWTRSQHQIHFCATLLIMVIEIQFNFQIVVQCAEKTISKITFHIHLALVAHLGKGLRTMGWPEKHDKTGFQHGQRWVNFFYRDHTPQLKSVGSGVHWFTELFSLCLVGTGATVCNSSRVFWPTGWTRAPMALGSIRRQNPYWTHSVDAISNKWEISIMLVGIPWLVGMAIKR